MSNNGIVAAAIIGGVFGFAGAVVANLDKVQGALRSVGIHAATHVGQASESPPAGSLCDDESDLGRIVIHSASNGKHGIFFCGQGAGPNYKTPSGWYVANGISASQY